MMAGGRGKKKRNSKDSTGSNGKKKGSSRKKGGGGGGACSSSKSGKVQGDIFSEGAVENAYLLCHNVQVSERISLWLEIFRNQNNKCIFQDVLKVRGFPWPDAKKKKGKKR